MTGTPNITCVAGRGIVPGLALALALVTLALPGRGAAAAPTAPLAAQVRPGGSVSADGLTVTDGQRTLRASQVTDLDPGGQQVAVAGSGYDTSKGIYVALCLVTPGDQPPSPCGGGIDIDGTSGASAWISSNPPSYGVGLASPYGAGGTFSTTVAVSPVLSGGFDCRQVQCAIVTRNDHVRTADRGQDLLLPVRFGTGAAAPAPTPEAPASTAPAPTTVPPTTAPPTTLAPPPAPTTTAPAPAPEATLSDDGRTASEGGRSLTVSQVEDLAPDGDVVTVEAEGFDEGRGVLVSVCRVAESPSEAPGPCLAGATPGSSVWISSDPPEYAADLVEPYDDGGFSVELDVAAVIDADTDCRKVECAVVVRRDDTDADDRTLDLAVPVAFAEEQEAPATTTTAPATDDVVATADAGSGSGGGPLPWALGAVGLLAAVGATLLVLRARHRGDVPPGAPAGEGT